MNFTYRPIGNDWPTGRRTPGYQRTNSRFESHGKYVEGAGYQAGRKIPWSQTLALLDRELRELGASTVVFQIDAQEQDFKLDGDLRANARIPDPAVIVSFKSKHGDLRYFCDKFTTWQDNIRAIALGLEALRKVERYGITKRGEQYVGWKALPESTLSRQEAEAFLRDQTRAAGHDPVANSLEAMFRIAAKRLHPDMPTGSREAWDKLQRAKTAAGL